MIAVCLPVLRITGTMFRRRGMGCDIIKEKRGFMIDKNMPLEEIAKKCGTMEELNELLGRCECENNRNDVSIEPQLLKEAIDKTKQLETISRSDIQRLFKIGYPKAAKLFEMMASQGSEA